MSSLNHYRRKKFSSVFTKTVDDNDLLRLHQIYSLQLLSEEQKLSSGENKIIDDIVQRYDCSERVIEVYMRRWVASNFSFSRKAHVHNEKNSIFPRWFLLTVVILALAVSSMQFLQFCIIGNVIQVYFGIESRLIDFTSILYMLIHFLAYVPLSLFCEKKVMTFDW